MAAGDKPEGPPAEGALGRVSVMSMEAGRIFPVNIHYLSAPASDYVSACVATVLSIHSTVPPCARNPKPQTPNPKPQTPNPKPQTPNPKPQTRTPKPQTPNPKPQNPDP